MEAFLPSAPRNIFTPLPPPLRPPSSPLPDELSIVQLTPRLLLSSGGAIARASPAARLRERVPEPQRLIARTGDYRLSIGAHGQIQHAVGMSSERRNHVERGVLPYTYLILSGGGREAVR